MIPISYTEYQLILKSDFMSFMERAFYELNPQATLLLAPYIEIMASKLDACRHGRIKRLIINLPPRYLKSHCASVAFVAWLLGQRPATQIICASYGQDLADKLALDCRKVMSSDWYQSLFSTRLASDKKAVNDFMTTEQGLRMSTSVGGVLTGRGADFLIIDDPLKPDDALSETRRNSVNNWYDGSLLSRLNDKINGCIIIIMQRLHQDDLVAHVLGQEDWEVVTFPAIAETDEEHVIESVFGSKVFRRSTGEPLHAGRETLLMLETTRQKIGDYNFSSQYQQNPIPIGGAMVKYDWLQYYDELPPPEEIRFTLQSWDTAVKSGELNDYSACTTWVMANNRYYLVDVYRKRANYPDLKRAVMELGERYRPNVILIEDKASGSSLIQDLRAAGEFRVKPYQPPTGTDKIMRLHAQTALFENALVFLPRQASWLQDYRVELTSFPGSKFDDMVDSTTQALDYLKTNFNRRVAMWERLGK